MKHLIQFRYLEIDQLNDRDFSSEKTVRSVMQAANLTPNWPGLFRPQVLPLYPRGAARRLADLHERHRILKDLIESK
ncbi:hypothetical protein Poly21_26810 [Allorhodopirellula heiligendammensis]|uniref:Uncharacterized protein n=1 Tax=Allorhodopirellula heiligendammensis TaxID=2714739 RepID=A0A5C6BTZ1_9BACT|nr:hypothetical protein Poly21_26810 [Allorhodopirellula heiligendammensis]